LRAAQSKPEKKEPVPAYAELEKAPEKFRAKVNPLDNDKDRVAAESTEDKTAGKP